MRSDEEKKAKHSLTDTEERNKDGLASTNNNFISNQEEKVRETGKKEMFLFFDSILHFF